MNQFRKKSIVKVTNVTKGLFLPKVGIFLIIPLLLIRLFTGYYPLLYNLYYSFTDYSLVIAKYKFSLENYARFFTDSNLKATIIFTIIYAFSYTFLVLIGSLLLANFLNLKFFGRNIIRTIIFLPWAIAPVVTGIVARSSFNNLFGFIPDLFKKLFSIDYPWLAHTWSARTGVILWASWRDVGFWAVIFLAALQLIPDDVLEASKIDGANAFQLFFKVKLPMIKTQVFTMLLFSVLWSFLAFDIVHVLTNGGPGYSTAIFSETIFKTFIWGNFGYASSQVIVLFLFSIILLSFGLYYINKKREEL
jgi:ABC-type sugar transport system permease subunit